MLQGRKALRSPWAAARSKTALFLLKYLYTKALKIQNFPNYLQEPGTILFVLILSYQGKILPFLDTAKADKKGCNQCLRLCGKVWC